MTMPDGSEVIDGPRTVTPADIIGIVSLIDSRLGAMESRITARLDRNTAGATERWQLHENEHAANMKRHEGAMQELRNLAKRLDDHLDAEADEDLANATRKEARLGPWRNAAHLVNKYWLQILFGITTAVILIRAFWP